MNVSIAAESPNVNQPPELDTILNVLRDTFESPHLRLDGPATKLTGGF